MLSHEVLARLAEADRRESELVVGRMIAAAAEAIRARHRPDLVRRDVDCAPALDEARQLARRRVFGTLRVHADRGAVDDAAAALVVADDVVVEDGGDRNLLGDRLLRVQPRADQSLLFAGVAHEDERRVEVDAALAEDARELDRQRRPAAIVVDARREVVERYVRIGRPRRRRIGIGRRSIRAALATGTRHRVVVAADVDPPRRLARQDRHHVSKIHTPRDARALRRHVVGVEADHQLRAVALHLLEDPLARRADAAGRRIGRRQGVARLEALELLEDHAEALLGDGRDELADPRIDFLGQRRPRRRRHNERKQCDHAQLHHFTLRCWR